MMFYFRQNIAHRFLKLFVALNLHVLLMNSQKSPHTLDGVFEALAIKEQQLRNKFRKTSDVTGDVTAELERPHMYIKRKVKPTVLQLKLSCDNPELVEAADISSPDPYTLLYIRAQRATIPVCIGWKLKSRYLTARKAITKQQYELPSYIEATKISNIRALLLENDAQKSLRQKQRERVRPGGNRINIDYDVLHDAFFTHATKPKLLGVGDVYYEGKEEGDVVKMFVPGNYSPALREALGMVSSTSPPPWLDVMQRIGPPPAYSHLDFPGVNAPIPAGCSWGAHGWGAIPLDRFGNPLVSREPCTAVTEELSFWGETT